MSYSPTIYVARRWLYLRISFTTASGLLALPPPNTFTCTPSGVNPATGKAQFLSSPIPCYASATATGFDVFLSSIDSADDQPTYQWTMFGVRNAPSARVVSDIKCQICYSAKCDATDALVPEAANEATIAPIQFTPGVQYAKSIEVKSSKLTNSVTDATSTFQVSLANPLPPKGRVILKFPKSNQGYLTKGAPAGDDYITKACCLGKYTVSATYGVKNAVSQAALPFLTSSANPAGYSFQATFSADALTIYLDNAADIPALQTITFTITPTTNPPSLQPISGFSAETMDANGYEIEESVGTYSMNNNVASTFVYDDKTTPPQLTAMVISTGDYKVGATDQTYKFEFHTLGGIPMGARLDLVFPIAGWKLNCGSSASWPKIACVSSCACSQSGIKCDAGRNMLQFTDCWPTLASYVHGPGQVIFDLNGMTNPISIAKEYFQMTTYEMEGATEYKIDETGSLFFLEFTMGAVYGKSVYPSDPTIFSSLGRYNFTLSFQHPVPSDYILKITLPRALPVLQKSACPVLGLGSAYSCTADSASGVITLTGLVSPGKTLAAETDITFSIGQSIQNPGGFVAPGTYSFLLTTAGGGEVDTGTWTDTNTTHYEGSTILAFTGSISTTVVGAKGVALSFTVYPRSVVPQDAYIVLKIPEAFEPEPDGKQGRLCMRQKTEAGLTGPYQKCRFDFLSRNMTLTGGFSGGPTAADPPTLRFTVPGWANPRSATGVNGTGKFNITIYTKDDQEMYRFNLTDGPWFRIEALPEPAGLTYTRSSNRNGVSANYTLQISPANDLYPGDLMYVTLPHPVRFTLYTKCIGNSYWLKGDLNCTITQQLDQVTFVVGVAGAQLKSVSTFYNVPGTRRLEGADEDEFLHEQTNGTSEHQGRKLGRPDAKRDRYAAPTFIPRGSLVELDLTRVSSPPSLRPATGSITYRVTTNSGGGIEAQSKGLAVGNTEPGVMNSALAAAVPSFMEKGAPANYTLAFVPLNFETNMKILFKFPPQITFPKPWDATKGCQGLRGLSQPELACILNPKTNTVLVTNGLAASVSRPDSIEIEFLDVRNPTANVKTSAFQIETYSADGYAIDVLATVPPVFVNFYCTFPCQTCNETVSTECFTCYADATPFIYIYKNKCLDVCPAGMWESAAIEEEVEVSTAITSSGAAAILYNPNEGAQWETRTEPATCRPCKGPCATCGISAVDCLSCIPKHVHYPVDNTCYPEIHWYFPFLAGALFFSVVTILIGGCARTQLLIPSLLPLLCLLEVGVWLALVRLYLDGQVTGERPLSIVSLAVHILLNLFFAFVHYKLMMLEATGPYLQLFKAFRCSSWLCQGVAYFCNFKISLILVSHFAGRPIFSGSFSGDSWQKFNIFSVLYIALVYLPFTADFYLYFIANGLRQLTSYIALEAVVLMTLISMILMLLLLQECSCTGIAELDLGGRAGLKKDKSMTKKKRRSLRTGMGNEEGDYDDEYDSEEENYYDETPEVESGPKKRTRRGGDSEEGSEEDDNSNQNSRESTIRKRKGSKKDAKQLDMLEALATQMKEERDILEAEKARIAKEERKLLKERQRQAAEYEKLREGWAQEKKKLRKTVKNLKTEKKDLNDKVEATVQDRLGAWDGNPRKDLLGNVIIALPPAVYDFVEFAQEIEGDEEYWLQNLSAAGGDISDASGILRERDGSLLEYRSNTEAALSYLASGRSMEADQELRAAVSQGGVAGDDVSGYKTMNATELGYMSKDGAVFGQLDKSLKRDATEQEFLDNASGLYSQGDARTGKSFENQRDGTDIEQLEGRSAEFGSVSAIEKRVSQRDSMGRDGPVHDLEGHSGESDEGIVADHAPFNGIKDAIANQERLRQGAASGSDQSDSQDDDNRPSGRQRRIKQVLYSDKSESSVDEMMQDTPSNYNVANGRLEGKSMGLKAILLFAKNQGVSLGGMKQTGPGGHTLNELAQIQEESAATPQETQHQSLRNAHAQGFAGEGSRPQLAHDDAGPGGRGKTKPTPGMAKRFKEPADNEGSLSSRRAAQQDGELGNIRKNNFV